MGGVRASLRRWLSAASFLAIAGTSGFVAAQSPKDIAAAKQAFKEGDEAERRGDFETALARYEAAIKVKETPQLYLRIGAAKEKLGRLVAALASYRQGLEKAAEDPGAIAGNTLSRALQKLSLIHI